MQPSVREALRRLFREQCGYCGVQEIDVGGELTVDHFQPVSREGADDFDNLVYCCHTCNSIKGNFWQPQSERRLLHPLRDDIATHMTQTEVGTLVGLTPTGTFHIDRLRLNRTALIQHRLRRLRASLEQTERASILERLQSLEQTLHALTEQILRRGN